MLKVVVGTIGIFLVVFLEHFFLGISSFSIFILLSVITWNRVSVPLFAYFGILTSLALDVTLHQPLGFHFLILGTVLLLLSFVGMFTHLEGRASRYAALLVVFLISYFASIVSISLIEDGLFPIFNTSILLGIFFNSLVSVVICFVSDILFSSIREEKGYERIRLK